MSGYLGPECALCRVIACDAAPGAKTPPRFCPAVSEAELLAEARGFEVFTGQVALLARAGTEFNVVMGLCVGHNPVAALYTSHSYYRRLSERKEPEWGS